MGECGEDASETKLLRYAGGTEYKKILQPLRLSRVAKDFIEDMACPGGCVGEPSKHKMGVEIRRSREALLKHTDDRGVFDNLKSCPMEKFSIHRDGHRDLKESKRAEGEA